MALIDFFYMQFSDSAYIEPWQKVTLFQKNATQRICCLNETEFIMLSHLVKNIKRDYT